MWHIWHVGYMTFCKLLWERERVWLPPLSENSCFLNDSWHIDVLCEGISSYAVLVCNPLGLLTNNNCFRLLWGDFRPFSTHFFRHSELPRKCQSASRDDSERITLSEIGISQWDCAFWVKSPLLLSRLVADEKEMTIFGSDSIVEERESFPTVYEMTGCRQRSRSSVMI